MRPARNRTCGDPEPWRPAPATAGPTNPSIAPPAGGPGKRREGWGGGLDPDGGRGPAGGQPVPAGGGDLRGEGAGGAGGAAVPQGRRDGVVPAGVRTAVRGVRVRGGPGRPAGDGVVGGGGGR